MAKLQYSIVTRHRNKPGGASGGPGFLMVGVDAGNAGSPEVKLNSGAWEPLPLVNGLYKYQIVWDEPDVQLGWNDIYYRDDNGERMLGSYRILNWVGDFNPGNEGCRVLINLNPDGEVAPTTTYAFYNTTIRVSIAVNMGSFVLTASLNPDGVSDYKASNQNSVTFQLATINMYIASGVLPSVFTGNSTNGCKNELARDVLFQDLSDPPLQVSYNKTDVTSSGGNDGTITLNPTGGTGSYTYLWGDGATTKDRSGLIAGTYTVTVTSGTQSVSLEIVIGEPLANYFFIPPIQSFRFVERVEINNCTVLPTPDNQLYCDYVKNSFNMMQKPFVPKVVKCDVTTVQIRSNYSNHLMELVRRSDGVVVKTFDVDMKVQLAGIIENFNVFLVNNGNGQTRIYFQTGDLPIPVSVGDPVSLLNNPDGMNGEFIIQAVKNDELAGSQYLLINLNFTVPYPSSSAVARFVKNKRDYNIYEAVVSLGDVANGEYYLHAQATGSDTRNWDSEPMNLQVDHPGTHLVEFRNSDNKFGIVYSTGITHKIRVESHMYKATPGGDDENYRQSDYVPVKLDGQAARKWLFEVFNQPWYRHEVLSVAFRHTYVAINGVEHIIEEGYGEPKWRTRYPLANAEVTIEQVNWLEDDVTGDGGESIDSGYYKVESGYLKVAQ